MQLLLLLLLLLHSAAPASQQQRLRVETPDAIYHGRLLSLTGLQTVVHLGIPYAQPPLGSLRFAEPLPWVPPPGSSSHGSKPEINATRAPPACVQRPDPAGTPARMSEDCLHLNVHAPAAGSGGTPAGLPVLVWLHGGYFETGGISDPDAGAFAWDLVATTRRLLVVEVAYRLGIFGFFSGGSGGNAGLKDQQLALAWIARNIEFFGGRNGSVTLAGLDAGAAAAGFHLLSAGSRDLFQRCAFFGGSPLAGWAFVRDRAALAEAHAEFYRLAGCPPDDAAAAAACLRNLSAAELNSRQAEFNRAFNRIEFPPVLDGAFLVEDPLDAFQRGGGSFEAKTALIGATNLEGIQLAFRALRAFNLSGEGPSGLVGQAHRNLLAEAFRYLPRFPERPTRLAREFLVAQLTAYPSDDTGAANFDLLTRALSQLVTVCASNQFADHLANGSSSSVFVYQLAEPDPNAHDYRGAGHGRDVAYFVGEPLRRGDYDQAQKDLSSQMMNQLLAFVATGNLSHTGWQPTTRRGLQFYRFLAARAGSGSQLLRGGFERQDCRLWDELLPWLSEAGQGPVTSPPGPSTEARDDSAEAKFWQRCNATFNTVSIVAVAIGAGLVVLLIACVILVARGRRSSAHDSVELYKRVTPLSSAPRS